MNKPAIFCAYSNFEELNRAMRLLPFELRMSIEAVGWAKEGQVFYKNVEGETIPYSLSDYSDVLYA